MVQERVTETSKRLVANGKDGVFGIVYAKISSDYTDKPMLF